MHARDEDTAHRLRELLELETDLAPAMAGGLSGHRAMTLIALAALGGSSSNLDRFAESYEPETEVLPPAGQMLRVVGLRNDDFRTLTSEIRDELEFDPDVAVDHWARIPGIGGHAFHGLIRTAYGYELPDELGRLDELARGLAYWDVAATPPLVGRGLPTASLRAATQSAAALGASYRETATDGLIFEQFVALYDSDGVADELAVWLPPGDLDTAFRDYLDVACDMWASYPTSFLALHLVTSAHAAWVLRDALTHAMLLPVVLGSYAVLGAGLLGPCDQPTLPEPSLTWEELTALALASNDPHVVKPTYSLRELVQSGLVDDERARRILTLVAPNN